MSRGIEAIMKIVYFAEGNGEGRAIMTYTFTGAEAAGTEIMRTPKMFGNQIYTEIRKIAETGIATTTGKVGIASNDEDQVDDDDFFAAAAALNAGDTIIFTQSETEEKTVNFRHQLTVKTAGAAVGGNAGLTLKLDIKFIPLSL
jgi:hypothetical protein